MLYWDSSALIASFMNEKETERVRSFSEKIGEASCYTAIITPLEVESAIQRRLKERSVSFNQAENVRLLTAHFRKETYSVVMDHNVLDIALHLQKIYRLRPADAIQLASARAGTDNPSKIYFLCLDNQLNEAAKREGFDVPF